MGFLKVSGISKQLGNTKALDAVSFEQAKGRKLAIVGASGSGKTTLLKIIGGLEQPGAGAVYFNNSRVEGPDEKLIPGHPRIAYLSQHFELRNNYRMEELLEYANTISGKAAQQLYEVCKISHLLERKNDALSGGEKQRIALARLLTTSPSLLLLDEPFSNLDIIHKNILKGVISNISAKLHITCLLVSHDPLDILSWADEILVMQEGKLIQQGTPEALYSKPVNLYTGSLFGNYNLIPTYFMRDHNICSAGLPADRWVFLRPEHIELVHKDQDNAVPAVVVKLDFMGSFYESVVVLYNFQIRMKLYEKNVQEGDTVYIRFQPAHFWYLDEQATHLL